MRQAFVQTSGAPHVTCRGAVDLVMLQRRARAACRHRHRRHACWRAHRGRSACARGAGLAGAQASQAAGSACQGSAAQSWARITLKNSNGRCESFAQTLCSNSESRRSRHHDRCAFAVEQSLYFVRLCTVHATFFRQDDFCTAAAVTAVPVRGT